MLAGLALTPRLARERNSNNVSNNSNSNSTDVEMQSQQQTPQRHERETSGRSILSNIGSTLSNLRERERDQDLRTAVRRAGNVSYDERGDVRERDIRGFSSTAAGFNPNQLNNRNQSTNGNDLDLEAQVMNPPNDNLSINPLTTNSNTPAIIKVSTKVRKEREEQSTLFGPNLANYFSSGASTTGPINSTNPNNINPIPTSTTSINNLNHPSSLTDLNNGIPETPAAIPETPGVGEAGFSFAGYNSTLTNQAIQQKKLRLGSRGRARGASLSGLSQSLENSESILNLNKAYNRGENGTGEESLGSESITMAEGIEIETLKKWIEKSSGCGPLTLNSENGNGNVGGGSGLEIGNAVCSTLQAFVNLKRNTIRLTTTATSNSDSNIQTSLPAETTVDVAPSPNLSSPPTSPLVGQESKVGGGAVTIDHPLSSTTENPTSSSSSLSNPTHLLHFEYDCASPSASIQIFVRASRKHGSWSTWQAKQQLLESQQQASTSKQDQEDGLPKGPPPHVLGWPVYFNKLKKGFGKPNKAELNLRLNLYAPPSTNSANAEVAVASNDGIVEKEKFTGGMGLEEIMTTDQFIEPNSTRPIQEINPNQNLNLSPNANENLENKVKDLKEKEKGNENKDNNNTRETLKIALVVEALDEDFKPLKEPNLQTTYLRMSSNSFNDVGNRIWSVQVEGQEAEVRKRSCLCLSHSPFSFSILPLEF